MPRLLRAAAVALSVVALPVAARAATVTRLALPGGATIDPFGARRPPAARPISHPARR